MGLAQGLRVCMASEPPGDQVTRGCWCVDGTWKGKELANLEKGKAVSEVRIL